MRFLRWIDRNLWSTPVIVFLMACLGFGVWSAASSKPVLLGAASPTTRQAVYSSLAGTSGTLFGITVAVVTILVAFAPRADPTPQGIHAEHGMTQARTIVIGSLLTASFFMLVVSIAATIGLAVDSKPAGNSAITTLVEAAGIAGIIGLLVGGAGLALVIAERSRQ